MATMIFYLLSYKKMNFSTKSKLMYLGYSYQNPTWYLLLCRLLIWSQYLVEPIAPFCLKLKWGTRSFKVAIATSKSFAAAKKNELLIVSPMMMPFIFYSWVTCQPSQTEWIRSEPIRFDAGSEGFFESKISFSNFGSPFSL